MHTHRWLLQAFSQGYNLGYPITRIEGFNFIYECKDLQFNVDSFSRQNFSLLSEFLIENCWVKIPERKLSHGLSFNKSTQYLLDYGEYSVIPTQYIAWMRDIHFVLISVLKKCFWNISHYAEDQTDIPWPDTYYTRNVCSCKDNILLYINSSHRTRLIWMYREYRLSWSVVQGILSREV